MARTMDIDIRIERQEKKILKLKTQLEEAQDQYDKLIQEKNEADKKGSSGVMVGEKCHQPQY